jgi:hypothetical protein
MMDGLYFMTLTLPHNAGHCLMVLGIASWHWTLPHDDVDCLMTLGIGSWRLTLTYVADRYCLMTLDTASRWLVTAW